MINNIGIMQGRLVPREIKSRLQSFPFAHWKKEIDIAKKYKINFIEWTIDYKNFLKNPIISNPQIVKNVLRKKNIKVKSITCDFFMQRPFFKNIKNSNEIFYYLNLLVKSCHMIGINYIVLPLVDKSSIKNSKEEKFFIKKIKEFEKNIYTKNIKILFETDYKPLKVIKFLKNFNKNFGINYDSGNSASLNYNIYDEFAYFNRVFNVHIKDRNPKKGSVSLGKGNLNLDNLILKLKQKKYKGRLILQTYIPKNGKKVLNETLKNYNYLKKTILKND
jgi:L-ribulose-5-phosphate 3-epimerase